MAFTVEEFRDLLTLLEAHPEWRVELRRLVLTDELLVLPERIALLQARSEEQFQALIAAQQRTETQVAALTAAQQRMDAQLSSLTEQVAALTAVQQRMDAQLSSLTEQVAALTAAQQRTEAQVAALTAAQQRMDAQLSSLTEQVAALTAAQWRMDAQLSALTKQVEALTEAQQRTEARVATLINDIGDLKGDNLEARYYTKGHAYFRRIVRRPHVLTADEMTTLIDDALDLGTLSDVEADDLAAVDVVVRGQDPTDRTEMYLAVEVSWGVGIYDVERAVRRAALLTRLGLTTTPVVAGKWITPEGFQLAQHSQVRQLLEGRLTRGAEDSPEERPAR